MCIRDSIWGVGTIANFVASYVPMIGPATSFSLGEGNTMISAIWGIFVWKEFHGAGNRVKGLLATMFFFFVLGLTSIALAPLIHWQDNRQSQRTESHDDIKQR